jgi:GGDEF domain-containing protein
MATEFPPILLALSSASLLARLHQSWLLDHDIPVLGVTTDGADAARWMVELPAQLALCDAHILRHAAVQTVFASPSRPPTCRIVLVVVGAGAAAVPDLPPVCAVLESDMDPHVVAHHLRTLAALPNGRPLLLPTPAYEAKVGPRQEDEAGRPEDPKRPRAQDPLTLLLRDLQGDPDRVRDRVTGLATSRTLTGVLTALPALNQAATIAVVALRPRKAGEPLDADEEEQQLARPLRAIAAGLRAHLRRDDLVCRLNGPAFAVVLSHPPDSASPLARRLRGVLDALQRLALGERSTLAVKIGFGFCEPGAATAPSLARAWQAATG